MYYQPLTLKNKNLANKLPGIYHFSVNKLFQDSLAPFTHNTSSTYSTQFSTQRVCISDNSCNNVENILESLLSC